MTCGSCGGGTSEGIHLCLGCRDKLLEDLREVESMVEALWASAARMDVGSGSVGSSGHSMAPDPTNSRAYDAGRTLNVVLTGWAHALGYREPHAVRAANVLVAQIREVRAQDWAPDLARELHDALGDCRKAMDRSGPLMFAGICPTEEAGQECGTPVYAPEGKPEARCQTCGSTWDVTEWRARAIAALGPATGTAVELSRILSDPIRSLMFPQNKIAVWVNRGKLTPIGYHGDKPVYQVRKVRNLWERALTESAARSERMKQAKAGRERDTALTERDKRRMENAA